MLPPNYKPNYFSTRQESQKPSQQNPPANQPSNSTATNTAKKQPANQKTNVNLLRMVPPEQAFRFYTEKDKPTGDTARSTVELAQKLEKVPVQSVNFHFQEKDLQKWFDETIGDDVLAQRIDDVKQELKDEELRKKLLKVIQTRISELQITKADRSVALRVSAYTIGVFAVITYFLVSVWPSTTADVAMNSTRTITFYFTKIHISIGPETSLLYIMIFSGIIGACVFSLFAVSHHLGADKDFSKDWQAWYLLRPLIGGGLALVFYFLLRGGVLSIGANLSNLNLVGVAAVSALVGMFAEHAMHKLQDLADTLFGSAPDTAKASTSTTSAITTTTQTTDTAKK